MPLARIGVWVAAAALMTPQAGRAQEVRDSAVADSVRRVRGVDVIAERVGVGLSNPLLLGGAAATLGSARLAEQPVRVLPDALRELPGVQVQQTNAGHGAVILRGLIGNQVLVLVDGVRLNNATVRDGPNQLLGLVDPGRVERLEVVRGPGSVLFGSDAMGGVVNAVTASTATRSGGTASIGFSGADAGVRVRLQAGGRPAEKVSWRSGVTAQRVGELTAGEGLVQPGTAYRSFAADASVQAATGRCGTIAVSSQVSDLRGVSRYDRLVNFRPPAPGADAEFLFTPQEFWLAALRWSGAACGGRIREYSVTAGWQSQREGRLQRAQGLPGPVPDSFRVFQRDDVTTLFVTGWVEPALAPGMSVRLGGDIYRDAVTAWGYTENVDTGTRTPTGRITGEGVIPAGRFPDGATATSAGAYVHAARVVGADWRVIGGARVSVTTVRLNAGDDFGGAVDATARALTLHGGATLYRGPWTLTAHAGQSFRAPNIYDYATVANVPGGVQLPQPDLGPERGTSVELVTRYDRGRTGFQATAWHTWLDNLLDRIPGSYRGDTLYQGRRVFLTANLARAALYGVELYAATDAVGIGWRAQAFWTRGTQGLPGGAREPMTRIPPLSGSLAARRSLPIAAAPWVEAALRFARDQRRLSSRDRRDSRIAPGGSPSWLTVSLRAGADAGPLRLSAGLENLADRLYREHGSGIDAPGRHLWLRLEHRLGAW